MGLDKPILFVIPKGIKNSVVVRKDLAHAYNASCLSNEKDLESCIINEEDLESRIDEINLQFSALYVRHSINESIINRISLPVFAQHESPLNRFGKLSKKLIYLTDESLINYYPKAEKHIDFFEPKDATPRANKVYDILFIGTFGLRETSRKNRLAYVLKKLNWHKRFLNDFSSGTDILAAFESRSIITKIAKWFMSPEKLSFTKWLLLHQLRAERRNALLGQIQEADKRGLKIAFVTNEKGKDKFAELKLRNATLFVDLDFNSELKELCASCAFTICSTPLHASILNERILLALNCGSIPLVEPFKHNLQLLGEAINNFVFDYKSKRIVHAIEAYDSVNEESTLNRLKKALQLNYGKQALINSFQQLIIKHS